MKPKFMVITMLLVFFVSGTVFADGSTPCSSNPPNVEYCVNYGTGLANLYTFTPKDPDLRDFTHGEFYYWKINTSKAVTDLGFDPTEIIGAEIFFDNITNWDNNANILYVNMLDGKPRRINYYNSTYTYIGSGTSTGTDAWYWSDRQSWGNDFDHNMKNSLGQLIAHTVIGSYSDTNGYSNKEDVTLTFSPAQIDALKTFLTDNSMGFGFDPDCHFYNDKVSFKIYTQCTVPEPATMLLLGLGLVGLAGVGRKFTH